MPKSNESNASNRPSEEATAKRAYELYLQRGSVPGHETDDWFEAEAQLIAEANATRGASQQAATTDENSAAAARGASRRRDATPPGNGRRAARP